MNHVNGEAHAYYKPLHVAKQGVEDSALKEKALALKDPFRNSDNQESKIPKISTEDLMKALMKPKEIKRLLYLTIPFTRHLIADLDQKKGIFLDKQG